VQPRLSLVTLGVREVAASRRFYVDGLGWPTVLDLPEVVFVQVAPGVLLALFGADDLAADATGGLDAAGPAGRASLACNVDTPDQVDAAVRDWTAAGGTVVKAAQPAAFGGRHAYLADPDGFLWEVAHNPGLVVADDGTVSLRVL
jgi:uncharacterized protein